MSTRPRNNSTSRGSKWLPLSARISSSASSTAHAVLYGRADTSASKTSQIAQIRPASGIASPARPAGYPLPSQRSWCVRATELEIIKRLGQAVESRDEETGEHIERIAGLCHKLGLAAGLGADEAELLRRASAMHDVGKIAIPDDILHKPEPLTASERDIMQRHTEVGGDLLAGSRSPVVQLGEVIARTHHERWDGSGYPAGLAGEAIPLAGRICAICDVFDALVSARPYKTAWAVEDALDEIRALGGSHFDPRLVELFLGLVDARPRTPEMVRQAHL